MLQLVPLGNDSRSMTRTSSLNMLMLFMPMQRSCLNTMDGMFTDSHMPIKNVAVISLTFYLEEVDLYNDLKKVATQTFEIPQKVSQDTSKYIIFCGLTVTVSFLPLTKEWIFLLTNTIKLIMSNKMTQLKECLYIVYYVQRLKE